jgi:hypothetical protein
MLLIAGCGSRRSWRNLLLENLAIDTNIGWGDFTENKRLKVSDIPRYKMANIRQIGICCIATGVFGRKVLLECFKERWKISVGMSHDGVSSLQDEWVHGFSRISMF